MELHEWDATMRQLAREREALNATYQEMQEDMAQQAAQAEETGVKRPREELVLELSSW